MTGSVGLPPLPWPTCYTGPQLYVATACCSPSLSADWIGWNGISVLSDTSAAACSVFLFCFFFLSLLFLLRHLLDVEEWRFRWRIRHAITEMITRSRPYTGNKAPGFPLHSICNPRQSDFVCECVKLHCDVQCSTRGGFSQSGHGAKLDDY